MSELGEAERALLALAGDAHDPTDADRARVRAALAARLGAAAGLGVGAAVGAAATAKAATAGATGVATTAKAVAAGATGLGSAGTTAAMTGGALATKLVVAVALTATVGVGATVKLVRHARRESAPAAKTEIHGRRTAAAAPRAPGPRLAQEGARQEGGEQDPGPEPAQAPGERSRQPPLLDMRSRRQAAAPEAPIVGPPAGHHLVPSARPAPAAAWPVAAESPPSSTSVAPLASAAPVAPADPAPRATPVPTAPTMSSRPAAAAATNGSQACGPSRADLDGARPAFTVADEARLVHDGVRALHAGQPACALSLLDTHAHFYPHGVLAEEREAERAFALAALGREVEARAVAAAFLRAHPASPLGVRLRQRIPGLDAGNHGLTRGTPP